MSWVDLLAPVSCFHLVLIVFNLYQSSSFFPSSLKVTTKSLLKAPSTHWQGSSTSLSKTGLWSVITHRAEKKALEPSTDLPCWWFSIGMTLPITGPHEKWGLGAGVTLSQVKTSMLRFSSREIDNCLEYLYLLWYSVIRCTQAILLIFKCIHTSILHVFMHFYHVLWLVTG